MNAEARTATMRVGIFLAVGLLMGGLAVLAIGEKGGLFASKATYYVHFENVSGLVEGASVRLGGLDVGTVTRIEFPQDVARQEALITLSIKTDFVERVREDSKAFIDSKGLLGDKIINITLGSAGTKPLPDGSTLQTKTSPSMEHLATQIEDALASVTRVTQSADVIINDLASEEARADVRRTLKTVANLFEQVEHGEGVAHRILYDSKYANEVEGILVETRTTVRRLREAADRIDRTVAEIQTGEGMMHELVYGDTGKETITELRSAAEDLAEVVHEVREGNGLLHDVIFEEEDARILDELGAAAASISRMTANIEKGRGTLGGLVVDPSVYEDLKTVLGNVERNVLFKALMRFVIKEGDIERPAPVPPGPSQQGDSARVAP